ncbi:MAG: hypothetical protein D3923_16490 [Candidatus Electrothrix sp. AR3]|nr:hypothetical protein [Candidatus Electrothrix sp. AR3]
MPKIKETPTATPNATPPAATPNATPNATPTAKSNKKGVIVDNKNEMFSGGKDMSNTVFFIII